MSSRCLFVPSLPFREWPEVDRQAWSRAVEGDSYAEGGEAAHWRPATQKLVLQNYGVWLAWLRRAGGLTDVSDPSVRATQANLRAYLAAMRACGYAGRSCATRLRGVGSALSVMCPHFEAKLVSRAAARVEAKAKRARDVRSRRFAPEDLLAYAEGLMSETRAEAASPVDVALSFRDGLLLVLQTSRALRIANLGSIRIGQHLQRRGAGYVVQFGAEEMKGGRAFGFPWPRELVAKLEVYLGEHRQTLSSQRNGAGGETTLWLGRDGTPLKQDSVASIIRHHTERALGRGNGPHLMRHILATTLAEYAPQDIAYVASALGHTSLGTSHQNYVHANAVRAGHFLHEAMAARLKSE